MQNWKDLYTELSSLLTGKIKTLKWVDLWHNQVGFMESEHPFSTPAAFLSFRTLSVADIGLKVQDLRLQVDVYLFYETLADTYKGSFNQNAALGFLDLLSLIFAALHGTAGQHYSSMRRLSFSPIDTGGGGNLYLQSFACLLRDEAAVQQMVGGKVTGLEVIKQESPTPVDQEPLFKIPLP